MDVSLLAELSRIKVRFTPDDLQRYQRRKGCLLADVVSAGLLGRTEPPFRRDLDTIKRITAWDRLRRRDGFISAAPIQWANFTEPQITSGWAHFLKAGHTIERCGALFAAIGKATGEDVPSLNHIERVEAEIGRVDLFVVAHSTTGETHALCIEAKFGHFVTDGQLDKSAAYMRQLGPGRLTCTIIGPCLTGHTAAQAESAADDWSFLTWKSFLIGYDNALPDAADDAEFRRFRMTCFKRSLREISW